MKKICLVILIITCISTLEAQPAYKEFVFVNLGNTTIKSIDKAFETTLPHRGLGFSGIWAGEKNYIAGDVSLPAQALFSAIFKLYGDKDYSNDVTWTLIGYGTDVISRDNFRIGLGGSMDIRPFEVKGVYLNGFGAYLNTMYMHQINDNLNNTLIAHVGPIFTKRQTTPIDGWAYIFRNSFSFNFIDIGKGRKLGLSIIPELRIYRTLSNNEELWVANSKLISFGVSILY